MPFSSREGRGTRERRWGGEEFMQEVGNAFSCVRVKAGRAEMPWYKGHNGRQACIRRACLENVKR